MPIGSITSFNTNQLPLTLPIPIRYGLTFQGWHESSTFSGNPVSQIPTNTTSNKSYFASWTLDMKILNNASTPIEAFTFDSIRQEIKNYDKNYGPIVVIPNQINGVIVKRIASSAFRFKDIYYVRLPDKLEEIGSFSFANNKISLLELNSSLVTIGFAAFQTNKIENLYIPDSVITIRGFAFNLNKINNLRISNSLKEIEEMVFQGNDINILEIPVNITKIGNSSFRINKIKNLIIPSNVLEIDNGAFSVNPISILKLNEGLIRIGDYAFSNDGGETYSKKLNELIIPSTIESIGVNAFENVPLDKITIKGIESRFNFNWASIGFDLNLKPSD